MFGEIKKLVVCLTLGLQVSTTNFVFSIEVSDKTMTILKNYYLQDQITLKSLKFLLFFI